MQPNSVNLLEQRIVGSRKVQETQGAGNYANLKHAVPRSTSWRRWCSAGRDLVKMLCFCAMTHDDGPTERFKAVCKTGQGLPALMQKLSVRPTASHFGNRGLDP